MAGRLKKYALYSLCVLLCWALVFVPCFYTVKRAFASADVVVPSLARCVPSAYVNEDAQPLTVHVAYQGGSSEAGAMQDIAASDKVLSAFGEGASYRLPIAPAKPAQAYFPPAVPPTVSPAQSTVIPSSAGTEPSTGKAQVFDGYALLPQPNGKSFVYYDQTWSAYASHPYGANTVGSHGCGPTSMAMVVSNLTDVRVDPSSMADWSRKNGYCVSGRGTAYGLFPAAAAQYGISCTTVSRHDKASVVSALRSGKLLITVVGYGDFTRGRHFLLIRGITPSGSLLLGDSGKYENSLVEWSYDRVISQVVNGYFWVFG